MEDQRQQLAAFHQLSAVEETVQLRLSSSSTQEEGGQELLQGLPPPDASSSEAMDHRPKALLPPPRSRWPASSGALSLWPQKLPEMVTIGGFQVGCNATPSTWVCEG